jgi:uncharacterized protein YdcH (DUF465 family)
MQLQYLKTSHINSLFARCDAVESEYITTPSGVIERAPNSTDESLRQARIALRDCLNAIPDNAVIELQALMWFGRGDSGDTFPGVLDYSKTKFDHTSREYMASKSPLRQYVEDGLRTSRAVLIYG